MSLLKPTIWNRPEGAVETETWSQLWEQDWTPFHRPSVYWALEKYFDVLCEKKKMLKIFVPLCGKTIDMKWMADRKHEVVGLDICSQPIQAFFKDNDIPYTVEDIHNGTVYKSTDSNTSITVFCTNLFEVDKKLLGDDFDIIHDRASLTALTAEQRTKYCNVIKSMMAGHTRYFLNVMSYDETLAEGPPFSSSEESVEKLFGDKCTILKLDSRDAMSDAHRDIGLTSFVETAYLLRLKSSSA